jgi:hypothetical protein
MNATTLSHEMKVGTPEQTESARILEAVDNNETPGCYYVLVSTLDSTATPVVFFPYPPSLHITRACPPGYEGSMLRWPTHCRCLLDCILLS